jgi:hypothetical protein
MPVVWLHLANSVTGQDLERLVTDNGWRTGAAFQRSESRIDERPLLTADGRTRIVIYSAHGAISNGDKRIAVDGEDCERVADEIARRLWIVDRRNEPVFRRFEPLHTAACASDDGVYCVHSEAGRLLWHSADAADHRVVADGISSPVAIARGPGVLYVTSCDDPLASRLARVDPGTGTVTWLCDSLVRPTQIAVLEGVVYAACEDGLAAIDLAGRVERPRLQVPRPLLLGAGSGALIWVDVSQRHLVRFSAARTEVIALAETAVGLDVDGDRAYVLCDDGQIVEWRAGREPRQIGSMFERSVWRREYRGLVRLGPLFATTTEWDSEWETRVQCELALVGFPLLDEAPAELRNALATDEGAALVLADWLVERGVTATADQLRRAQIEGLGATPRDHSGELPALIATSLVTYDRERGYHLSGADVSDRIVADEYY